MADLKPFLDRVTNAQAAVQSIVNQIEAAMKLETPEGAEEALALESNLDEAIAKRDQAQQFYNKLVKAQAPNDLLKNFVPVSELPVEPEGNPDGKTMKRTEFQALDSRKRWEFIRSGGTLLEA
jgi:hypothetical protein